MSTEIKSQTSSDPRQIATEELSFPSVFRISPLIRLTLLSLYGALTLPLPFLSQLTGATISPHLLWVGLLLGGVAIYGSVSDRVVVDEQGIHLTYPQWIPRVFRRGWSLQWSEIQALKPRTTGQGGLVYYFLTQSGQGYLLPMRVVGFAQMVRLVEAKTGIDTRDVRPLSQPWMYLILLGFTLLLLLVDSWTIWNAIAHPTV